MAGIADALASVLYPNTTKDSLYSIGGQSILKSQMPVFKNPWTSLLANTAQGLVGYGLQGYGQQVVNEQNAENAAKMVPQLGQLGVNVTPEIQAGLTNTDPQKRALALALVERDMNAASKAAEQQQDFNLFKQKEDYKDSLANPNRAREADNTKNSLENQYRKDVEGQEYQNFQTTSRLLTASIKEAMKDNGNADLSLAVNAAKLRDPSSAAMSGEVQANEEAQGFLNKISGTWRRELEQKGKFSPETRAAFLSTIKNYFESAREAYESKADPMWKLAERKGLDPRNVVMVPYKAQDYADVLRSIPTAEQIRQEFDRQAAAAQLRQIQPRAPIVGPMGSQPQELIPVAPLPAPAADQQYIQIAPNQYIRIQKGK